MTGKQKKKSGKTAATTAKRKTARASGERMALGRVRDDALIPVPGTGAVLPGDYSNILHEIKQRISRERLRSVLAANAAMVTLYWDIGRVILDRQTSEGWGARVIDRLSADLRDAFPDMRGLSPRNLKYMRAFAAAWPDRAIVQRVIAQIPWRQNIALFAENRAFYEKINDGYQFPGFHGTRKQRHAV